MAAEAEQEQNKEQPEAEVVDVESVDVEKSYSTREVVDKLRRLADALEAGKTFEIMIAGNRIYIPSYAAIEFEYEQEADEEQVEIELRWKRQNC